MKTLFTAVLALVVLLPCIAFSDAKILDVDQAKYTNIPSFLGYVPDRFIVVLKDNVAVDHTAEMRGPRALATKPGFEALAQQFGVVKSRPQFPNSDRGINATTAGARSLARHYKVFLESDNLDEAVAAYSNHPLVERVERIGIHTLRATPNDTYYDDPPGSFPYDQWHYWDTYGIEADMAWDDETGSQTVLVGDLDIGCKWDHGDLGGSNPPGPNDASTNGNIWVNTGEIPGNSIDDDGNGYTDDVIGWDFVDRTNWYSYPCVDNDCGGADNDPSDGDGHGTHTAGTIAAITNNGYAVAGVAGGFGDGTFSGGGNGVKVVPCRIGYVLRYFGQDLGVVIMDYVAEAMYYMADLKTSGWNVAAINCSFGSSNSGGLGAATTYLINQDVMIVVAAGNGNTSSADYLGSRTDCLDVGATDQNGNPASFSNYGSWVDIAAPGVQVMSTITDPSNPSVDYVAYMSGTSMSSPHVVGVAALLESFDPSLTAAQKTAIILDPANVKAYNMTKYVGVGIIDVRKCLDAIGPQCDLTADFSGAPTSGCAPLGVSFTDLSTGASIDGWSWTFGDGGNSTAQNPNYTYNAAGTYSVSLTVSSSSQGCNDVVTKNGYITVSGGPTAGFVGSPTSGTEPLTVNFTNQSTDATSYSWTFGDAGASTATNPTHEYANAGTYTVTLTATNACGSDVDTKVDYITVNPCVSPTANFSGSPTTGEAPLNVSFTDLSTGAASWAWTFGDGGNSTQQNPNYTYNTAGTYTVTLTATNACGSDGNTKVDYITVDPSTGGSKAFALSDLPVKGTVTGDYTDTHASDNVYEQLTEGESGGKPSRRYSTLDHSWNFNIAGGATITFNVEAYRPDNAEGDNFSFEYSTDNANFTALLIVNSATEQMYTAAMPNSLSGTVYIRVVDTDHTQGARIFDDVFVDYMYIELGGTAPPPDTMHVNSVFVTRIGGKGNRYQGEATVTIYNRSGQPVVGASVSGAFSGPSSDSKSGTTDGSGSVTLTSQKTKNPVGNWCFTVTGVSLGSNVYDPAQNVETSDCESGAAKLVDGTMPYSFNLDQNYPNPFNPSTAIRFSLPRAMIVRLEVFNVLGQNVATLVNGSLTAGQHEYTFDASALSSGIYFYRLQADDMIETKKMILMK